MGVTVPIYTGWCEFKDIFTKIKSSLHTKANCGEYPGALDPYGYLRNTQDK